MLLLDVSCRDPLYFIQRDVTSPYRCLIRVFNSTIIQNTRRLSVISITILLCSIRHPQSAKVSPDIHPSLCRPLTKREGQYNALVRLTHGLSCFSGSTGNSSRAYTTTPPHTNLLGSNFLIPVEEIFSPIFPRSSSFE